MVKTNSKKTNKNQNKQNNKQQQQQQQKTTSCNNMLSLPILIACDNIPRTGIPSTLEL